MYGVRRGCINLAKFGIETHAQSNAGLVAFRPGRLCVIEMYSISCFLIFTTVSGTPQSQVSKRTRKDIPLDAQCSIIHKFKTKFTPARYPAMTPAQFDLLVKRLILMKTPKAAWQARCNSSDSDASPQIQTYSSAPGGGHASATDVVA